VFTLQEILDITSGALEGALDTSLTVTAVTTDSRQVPPESIFVCLRGETHDGHQHAAGAVGAGARVVLAATDGVVAASAPVVRVADTLKAYGQLARAWRRKLGTRLVAITGSSGKTSTKELTAAYLALFGAVLRTEANFNNEIGVPRTLLSLTPEHTYAVVEMGMRGPGEIGYLTDVAEPDVGMITNIGTAHIGRLGSQEAIADAKGELWQHLPAGKTAVVPFDDPLAARQAGRWGGRCVSWSLHEPAATVFAADVRPEGEGQRFTVYWKRGPEIPLGRAEVVLPFWGDHHRANALAAIAAGWALGLVPPARISLKPEQLPGRSHATTAGGVTLLNDAYNANPDSMRAALTAFAQAPGEGRRWVALGDMAELGIHAETAHEEVGELVGTLELAGAVAVGAMAASYAKGWPKIVPIAEIDAACRYLAEHLQPGDRLLLKASRAARFETLVECLEAKLGGKK
jgi:UDP-N-acetylmuramoyl-tripeptide--D-alanyl-D-alanine ligase